MLINLAFVKTSNGLFYYALSYIEELRDVISEIMVRTPDLKILIQDKFPEIPVRVVSSSSLIKTLLTARFKQEFVFTPTSHPFPFIDNQLVVVHDSFPFDGFVGSIKKKLFFYSLKTCRAYVGYVNKCDARAFIVNGGISEDRMRSMPNSFSSNDIIIADQRRPINYPLVVGLVGTDSDKKNYEKLFDQFLQRRVYSQVRFKLLGHMNEYVRRIISDFQDLDVNFVDACSTELDDFLNQVDLIVSVSTREGFNRPLARALSFGIPSWVVDAPIYREFYDGAVTVFDDVGALSDALLDIRPGEAIERPSFSLPTEVSSDFCNIVAWLKYYGAIVS